MANIDHVKIGTNQYGFDATKLEGHSLLDLYPIGSIYMSVNDTDPGILFGGTWERIKDKFLLCAGDTYTAGDTGGSASHTLTTGEMPAHTHTYTDYYANTTTGSHTLTINEIPSHFHRYKDYFSVSNTSKNVTVPGYNTSGGSAATNEGTYSTGGGQGHTHSVSNTSTSRTSGESGSGTAFSIMPPYLGVYVWKRTA